MAPTLGFEPKLRFFTRTNRLANGPLIASWVCRQKMVEDQGFEPWTFRVSDGRSDQLS